MTLAQKVISQHDAFLMTEQVFPHCCSSYSHLKRNNLSIFGVEGRRKEKRQRVE